VRLRDKFQALRERLFVISIPSGAIKSRSQGLTCRILYEDISIPSGAIKRNYSYQMLLFQLSISIPSGAIKSLVFRGYDLFVQYWR